MHVKKIFQLYNDLQKMYEKKFLKIRIHWKPQISTTIERVISIYLNQEQQKLLSRWDSLPGQAN